jgi:polyisoprenoid-binding protein YceI
MLGSVFDGSSGMKFWLRLIFAVAATAVLAACPLRPPRPSPPAPAAPTVPVTPAITQPVSGKLYRVVPAESEVRLLVYRSGNLAKLGHNHVITSHDLNGTIVIPDDPTQAHFEIVMPVALLAVDAADQRAQEGADFATQVSDSAREGTHKNMMKPEVLDGEHYPTVTVTAVGIVRADDDYEVSFQVDLRGAQHILTAPVHLVIGAQELTATGELSFKQSDLGITPFTALGGAIAVKDEMRVKFDIHAALSER